MATKKRSRKPKPAYLNLITGGKDLSPAKKAWITRKAEKLAKDKDVQVLAVNRPLIAIVSSQDLDPAKGLMAEQYINDQVERAQGRSRNMQERQVLDSAKYWYRDMIRLARSEGFTDMKKFFKESDLIGPADKKLFEAVGAFLEMENRSKRHGPG